MNLSISERGLDLIRDHEGCRLAAYKDSVGIATIGYGHTEGVKMGDTCTQAQAELWLRRDAERAERCVNGLVTVPLTQGEFDALCSFVFNLGCERLKKSTLLRKINDSDYDGAAAEFQKWVYAGGEKLAGLVARRDAEARLFETV